MSGRLTFWGDFGILGGVEALYKEFGAALRKARKDAGLTQEEVGRRVNLSRTSITNIERGKQHVALHQVFLLASAVGCQPEALLPDQEIPIEDLLSPDALAMVAEDEEGRDFAVRILRKSAGVRQPREGTPVGE